MDLLSSLLQPPVDFRALEGVCHVCALHQCPTTGSLRSIMIGEHSPKCSEDFLLLMAIRARSTIQVQSVHTVSLEGGASPCVVGPHAEELLSWRTTLFGKPMEGKQFLLTRGSGRSLDATWKVFSPDAQRQSCIVAPDEHLGPLLEPWSKEGAGLASPPVLPASKLPGPLSVRSLLQFLQSEAAATVMPPKPPLCEHLISIEAGAQLTRDLYVKQEEECPVQVLVLSTFYGDLDERAVGEVVFPSKDTVSALFERVSHGSIKNWSFEVWRRRKN